MPELAAYLNTIEIALLTSEVVAEYAFVTSKINTDDGYFRVRATLANGDYLEASEYFTVTEREIRVEDYRYQWMDGPRTVLRRRWDNTPHHPEVAGFPHHCHLGPGDTVAPGEAMNLLRILAFLEAELLHIGAEMPFGK